MRHDAYQLRRAVHRHATLQAHSWCARRRCRGGAAGRGGGWPGPAHEPVWAPYMSLCGPHTATTTRTHKVDASECMSTSKHTPGQTSYRDGLDRLSISPMAYGSYAYIGVVHQMSAPPIHTIYACDKDILSLSNIGNTMISTKRKSNSATKAHLGHCNHVVDDKAHIREAAGNPERLHGVLRWQSEEAHCWVRAGRACGYQRCCRRRRL